MNVVEVAKKLFGIKTDGGSVKDDVCFVSLTAEVCYKKLAIEACIGLIANVIAGCEFQTFKGGKEHRGETYYLFNVRPNVNYSAGEFWHKCIARLIKANEVLIIMQNDQLLVADSFNIKEKALNPNLYEQVTVGDFTFGKSFGEDEVLHIRLHDENISRIIDGLYAGYGKLITSAQGIYKRKNALRVVMTKPKISAMDADAREDEKRLYEHDFKAWFENDSAGVVLPLPEQLKLQDWSNNTKSTTTQTSRDIRALIDDTLDFTAIGFHIPVHLIRGDMADLSNQIDALIMFCIRPIAELLKDEINAKMFSKAEYLNRTYMKIDTSRIKMVDIFKYATAADKLFAAGVHTINDNLRLFDKETLDKWWADAYFTTKNYQLADALLEGGEKDVKATTDSTAV